MTRLCTYPKIHNGCHSWVAESEAGIAFEKAADRLRKAVEYLRESAKYRDLTSRYIEEVLWDIPKQYDEAKSRGKAS